jgi:hypothetical protein
MSKQRTKKSGNRNNVKVLPISIFIFIILSILALFIILNKGKVGRYSLVKIETLSDSDATSESDNKDTIEISVESKYLSSKSKEKEEIAVLINDEEVDISDIELTSSNEDVIKIKDGTAVAVSDGKSTITAKKDDLEATVDLHVITPITSITFTATNSTIKVGKSLQMKLVAKPSDASIETLKYKSSDEEIATVNSNGIVTGVAPGNVTITVTDIYSEIEKSVKLTIKK